MKMTSKTAPMNLSHLLINKLQALYDIENEIIKALPKMAKAATDSALKAAFTNHLEQTKVHAARLEEIFAKMDMKPKKLKCEGIRGIIEDGQWVISNVNSATALDANLAAAAQYVEFYEMAGYSSAIEWARLLEMESVVETLEKTLEEERETSDMLTELSAETLDQEALGSDENTEMETDADDEENKR